MELCRYSWFVCLIFVSAIDSCYPLKSWRKFLSLIEKHSTLSNQFTRKCNHYSQQWQSRKQHAFIQSKFTRETIIAKESMKLYDITEWRDMMFNYLPGSSDDVLKLGVEQAIAPPKEVCILPFPFQDVLVQGETKQLRLYEDRFIKLFKYCTEQHHSVVAMGLVADSGIVQTVPLCEIEAYNNMGNSLGVFVTIRVVGRAKLIDIIHQEPYIKAVCEEVVDTIPPNLELPNLLASNIENLMLLLSSMEHRYENRQQNNVEGDTEMKSDKFRIEPQEDLVMKRRIEIAKLDDTFYEEDEVDDDESEHDEDYSFTIDRRRRFRRACEIAMATDTQGYQGVQHPPATDKDNKQRKFQDELRSAQELTSISWGAFCTDILPDIETITYKIQALDSTSLFDRLNLASQMLRKKKETLQTKFRKAGLQLTNFDDNQLERDDTKMKNKTDTNTDSSSMSDDNDKAN